MKKIKVNKLEIDLDECRFLGKGTCGSVYLTPDKKAVKIFYKEQKCKHENEILQAVKGDKFFPKVYECKDNIMIREYIGGENILNYIKKHGLSRKLAISLIEMIEDFKKIGFKRKDMRFAHIFVQEDETVRVIDPRKSFQEDVPYPEKMLKGLRKTKVLSEFIVVLKEVRPNLYEEWKKYLQ